MSFKKDEKVKVLRLTYPDTTGTIVDPIPNEFNCVEVNWVDKVLSDGVELHRISPIHVNNLERIGGSNIRNDNPNAAFRKQKRKSRFDFEKRHNL